MDCGLRGSTQHLGLEIPVGMGRRCCDGPSYEYCGTDRHLAMRYMVTPAARPANSSAVTWAGVVIWGVGMVGW